MKVMTLWCRKEKHLILASNKWVETKNGMSGVDEL